MTLEWNDDTVNRVEASYGTPLWEPGTTEPGTWTAPDDTEQRWGYATPMCSHGQAGDCWQCETECVHRNYGPSCPDCAREFG